MRRSLLVLVFLFAWLIAGCDGDSDVDAGGAGESPTATPESPTPDTSPTGEEEGSGGDVEALAEGIIDCLDNEGIEAEFGASDFPTYEEKGEIGVTFEYEDIALIVPEAVTLWLHDSEEAAQKTQRGINENLLQGDTEAELVGTVVVDDFGTTLDEPEAAEQAEALQSCLP